MPQRPCDGRFGNPNAKQPPNPRRQKSAKGLRLHLSNCASGYKGVRRSEVGRYQAVKPRGEKRRSLGSFKTPVDAAVAYAKYMQEVGAEVEETVADGESEDEDGSVMSSVMSEAEEAEEPSQKRFVPRPRGRGPVGKEWDTCIGTWVPEGTTQHVWDSKRLPGGTSNPDYRQPNDVALDKGVDVKRERKGEGSGGATTRPSRGEGHAKGDAKLARMQAVELTASAAHRMLTQSR